MEFIASKINKERFTEKVFKVTQAAKADKDPSTINATAGCLYDEEGNLFTYKVVAECEKNLPSKQKFAYAASPSGNKGYVDAISKYILEDRIKNSYKTLATPGGTGAVYTSMKLTLDENDTVILPKIAWGNYNDMVKQLNLSVLRYDVYDLDDLFSKIDSIDGKVYVLINSPCQNPLGFAYSYEQWQKIINKLNNLNKEVVLALDIAYIDYASNEPKKFFELFNNINDNVLVLICASTSKSFSFYGERLGAMIAINNNSELVDKVINLSSRLARAVWSNCNNGAMLTVTEVLNKHYDEYIVERDNAIKMLKTRVSTFISEADECGLIYYPMQDGFFITLKIQDDDYKEKLHQRLMDNHIYTLTVNKGIRIAVCSIPLNKIHGLARRIKELM
jgi:aspartate/tyrosine/aromatic aminotransferase